MPNIASAASVFAAAAAIVLPPVAAAYPGNPPAAPSTPAPPAAPTDLGALPSSPPAAPATLTDKLTSSFGVPLGPAGLNIFGQSTASSPVAGALGLPQGTSGLSRSDILGQNTAPSAPGAGPGTPPNLNVFNNAYGQQLCLKPSAPGQCQQFGVEPGQENADVPAHQWLGRYIDMYRDGRLKGGLLGQMPQQQLAEPLPGTAPPPGTNIPPGLSQYLPDPANVSSESGAAPTPPDP
ncbi:hypothetical protein [Mycolicibacterium llatzerense]|uniref:hypothetical protein n=1 Tax=Mycolicibacterium llatzerense TaxID=280871 RepID=UPI0031D3E51A